MNNPISNENNKKVSCIIPAYNEGKRIKAVLDIATVHPLIDEIIVVDDGSKDNTREIAKGFEKVKLIIHETNKGKSIGLYDGIKASGADLVFFLDADLVGLNAQDITDLISPVLNGTADVSISLRRNSPKFWHRIGIDYISGERVLSRSIIVSHLEQVPSLRPFGFEVFLNRLIIKNSCRIKIVSWPNVDSPYKFTKVGFWIVIREDFLMMLDIFRTISILEPLYQIIKMKKLMVKPSHE